MMVPPLLPPPPRSSCSASWIGFVCGMSRCDMNLWTYYVFVDKLCRSARVVCRTCWYSICIHTYIYVYIYIYGHIYIHIGGGMLSFELFKDSVWIRKDRHMKQEYDVWTFSNAGPQILCSVNLLADWFVFRLWWSLSFCGCRYLHVMAHVNQLPLVLPSMFGRVECEVFHMCQTTYTHNISQRMFWCKVWFYRFHSEITMCHESSKQHCKHGMYNSCPPRLLAAPEVVHSTGQRPAPVVDYSWKVEMVACFMHDKNTMCLYIFTIFTYITYLFLVYAYEFCLHIMLDIALQRHVCVVYSYDMQAKQSLDDWINKYKRYTYYIGIWYMLNILLHVQLVYQLWDILWNICTSPYDIRGALDLIS